MDLSSVSAGFWSAGTVTVSVGESTGLPPVGASMAVALAMLVTEPASRSACVITCVAVQVMKSPIFSGFGVCGQVTVALSSATEYVGYNGTLPLLVTL